MDNRLFKQYINTISNSSIASNGPRNALVYIFEDLYTNGSTVNQYPNSSSFPIIGEQGKFYLDESTNIIYLWNPNTSTYEIINNTVINIVQTIGNSSTDVMSQSATTNMVFQDNDTNKIKIGYNANANSFYGIAIGNNAIVTGTETTSSIAIGKGATTTTSESLALGADTNVEAIYGTAIGYGSTVQSTDPTSTLESVVSFGVTNGSQVYDKSRLINIKDGINDSDASTIGQSVTYNTDGNIQLRENSKILGTNIELTASEKVTINSNGFDTISQGDVSIFADNDSTVKIESEVIEINSSSTFNVNGGDINLNVPVGSMGSFTQLVSGGKEASLFFANGDCYLTTHNGDMDNGVQITNGGAVLLYNYLYGEDVKLITNGGKAYYRSDASPNMTPSDEIATIGNLNTKQNIINYSISEVSTGETWYDDSIIYKKVLTWQISGSNITYNIPHNISDLGTVIKLDLFQTESTINKLPIFNNDGTMKINAGIDSVNLIITTDGSSISDPFGYGYAIIEYTKIN